MNSEDISRMSTRTLWRVLAALRAALFTEECQEDTLALKRAQFEARGLQYDAAVAGSWLERQTEVCCVLAARISKVEHELRWRVVEELGLPMPQVYCGRKAA